MAVKLSPYSTTHVWIISLFSFWQMTDMTTKTLFIRQYKLLILGISIEWYWRLNSRKSDSLQCVPVGPKFTPQGQWRLSDHFYWWWALLSENGTPFWCAQWFSFFYSQFNIHFWFFFLEKPLLLGRKLTEIRMKFTAKSLQVNYHLQKLFREPLN